MFKFFGRRTFLIIYALAVFILAFFSFFWNYNYPNSSQWDEVYHISSAEKYIKGSLFMESHPPLGKMFIALGEKVLEPNAPKEKVGFLGKLCFGQDDWLKRPDIIDKSGFLKVDQIQSYPTGFSFCGFRLMPVIFATLTAPLFFFLLFLLLRNAHLAAIFSSLYLFDNALILQSRSAMVDSIQIFFIILTLTYFVFVIEKVTGNLPLEIKNQNLENTENENLQNPELIKSKQNSQNEAKIQTIQKEENVVKIELIENPENQFTLAKNSKISWQKYVILGLLCGLSIATKHNAAIILVLPIALFIFELWTFRIDLKLIELWSKFTKEIIGIILAIFILFVLFLFKDNENLNNFIFGLGSFRLRNFTDLNSLFNTLAIGIFVFSIIGIGIISFIFRKNYISQNWLQSLIKVFSFSLGLLLMYLSVFAIHVSTGSTVIPDNNNRGGFYLTSDKYKEIIAQNATKNPLNLPVMIIDNWKYMQQYHGGVPKLDLCKRDDAGNLSENGSYPMTWPVMNRTISFRWEWGTKDGTPAKDNAYIRYSYLIGNPLIWSIGLVSIMLSLVLILGFLFFNLPLKNRRIFNYILTITALYLAYMIGVLSVERVMYLYHYLIPLIFTLILAPLLFVYSFGNLEDELTLENQNDNSPLFKNFDPHSEPNSFLDHKKMQTENSEISDNNSQEFQPTEVRSSRILEHKKTDENSEKNIDFEIDQKVVATNSEIPKSQIEEKLQSSELKNKNPGYTEYSKYFWYWIILFCGVLLVFLCFAYFSPFTYYQPLSREEFMMRNWFSFWQMRVVN